MAISNFDKEYRFLSNFYPCAVEFEGMVFPSSEAAFQAAKTTDMSIREDFTVMDPSEAKRTGRHITLRSDWEEVKYKVMLKIVRAKFQGNRDLAQKLLATGDEYLEEGNTWHDNIWGVCHCPRCNYARQEGRVEGLNQLGKILMQVRNELRT